MQVKSNKWNLEYTYQAQLWRGKDQDNHKCVHLNWRGSIDRNIFFITSKRNNREYYQKRLTQDKQSNCIYFDKLTWRQSLIIKDIWVLYTSILKQWI